MGSKEQLGVTVPMPSLGDEGQGIEDALVQCDDPVICTQGEVVASKRLTFQMSSLARDSDVNTQKPFKSTRRKESREKVVHKLQRRKKRAELERLKKSYVEELEKSNKPFQVSESGNQAEDEDEERRRLVRKEAEKEVVGSDLTPDQISLDKETESRERERRRLQREEAERNYRVALRVGIKGNLPEQEMIQIFEDNLQKEYNVRCAESLRGDLDCR